MSIATIRLDVCEWMVSQEAVEDFLEHVRGWCEQHVQAEDLEQGD
jgi:hypothetical protein